MGLEPTPWGTLGDSRGYSSNEEYPLGPLLPPFLSHKNPTDLIHLE